jgi:multidrug efflux pump subunit AcrB
MKKLFKKRQAKGAEDKLLPRFSLHIFDRPRTAAILWLCITVFGIFSYTTFLKREGFPSIDIPYSIISGNYFVGNPKTVDDKIAKPISNIVIKDSRVKSVQTQSQGSYYNVAIQYKEGTDANKAGVELEKKVKDANILPKQATIKAETPKLGFTARGDDMVVSVYSKDKGATVENLTAEAENVVKHLKAQSLSDVESVSVVDPFITGTDPATGQTVKNQTSFDRLALREHDTTTFYDSVAVGIAQKKGTDVIKLNDKISAAVKEYNQQHADSKYTAAVSATYANDIKDQIGELQKSLLEGLLAILIVGSIVIAVRASIITVIAMITVLASTLAALFLFGYSLNTITLFALILCLGLIVDDTIIMVEAIDAERRRRKDARETVKIATRKVSRAMVAATLTAALSFAPLLFVSGILGSFIRAIPATVITSLLVSLAVALIFIPFFARFLLLRPKQMGKKNDEIAAGFEEKVAQAIGKPMLWARDSKKKLFGVGIAAIIIGFTFIGAGGYLFQKVTFNIFPPSKDTNGLMVSMNFAPGTTITEAEKAADEANKIVNNTLGENLSQASFYANANDKQSTLTINLISYDERTVRSPELQKELQAKFKNFEKASVKVGQIDAGPPPSAFSVHIQSDNREASQKLAKDIRAFLMNKELTRPSGEKAKITEITVSDPGTYSRNDGSLYLDVSANFDADDTTTLVTLAQTAVEKEFDSKKLAAYNLDKDVLKFDFGQEDENQESFAALAMAFPVLLLAIYLLLAIQFRSLLQPLLIFMALPFSLFGITLGLYLTDNAFSFFAMLGFFALIGLSIKNTILLTDYANQLRREGKSGVDAAVGALGERFRPLVATSLTAVVSLIPLALSSPFWEGLAVVLIFGLLSSTLLVILVFPYYYLGAEYLRVHISRKAALLWIGVTIVLSVIATKAGLSGGLIPLIAIVAAIAQGIITKKHKK